MDTQQVPQPTLLMQKCVPLWEHGFHNWAQILGRATDGRPYFPDEREQILTNPSISFPLPQNLIHALKYLRAVLASTSLAHLQNIKNKINFTNVGDHPTPIDGASS